MKRLFILFIFFIQFVSFSQIFSNGTGGGEWTATTTWQGGVVPSSSSNVVIVSGDSVYTATVTSASCNNLTVQSNAKLAVFGGSGYGLSCSGTFTAQANSWFYNSNSSLTSFPQSAAYVIDNASNYVQTSLASSTFSQAGYDSIFGNVYMLKSGSTAGASVTINGNLVINTGAVGNTFRGGTINSRNHTVVGNVYVISGQWSCLDVSSGSSNDATVIWNIGGNVEVGSSTTSSGMARMGPFTSSLTSGTRTGIFNINGNLTFVNGARLQAGSSTSSTSTSETGIINLKGNFSFDNTSITATNSKGYFAINFTGNGTQNVTLAKQLIFNSTSMLITFNDTIASTSTVVFNGGYSWGTTMTGAANGDGNFVVNGKLKLGIDTLKGNQAFTLNPGATLVIGHPFGVNGNIQVAGTQTFSSLANFEFNGTNAQVTGSNFPSVNNLRIDNNNNVTLSAASTVNGTLHLENGNFDLNGQTLTFNNITGLNGTITQTADLNAPTNVNVGNLGAIISSTQNLGTTVVKRGFIPQTGGGHSGTKRWYDITPTNNTNLNATLVIQYNEGDELNGIAEANLRMFKSTNQGANWSYIGGTVNTSSNTVTTSGISSFSRWTLADVNAPIPVELISFTAMVIEKNVELQWSTATETQNYGWMVERMNSENQWTKIGFVNGHGNSTDMKKYQFVDKFPLQGNNIYRLVQTDYNGFKSYSNSIEIIFNSPLLFSLEQNYPNPFNPSTIISYEIPVKTLVALNVFDVTGKIIDRLVNEIQNPGRYSVKFNASNLSNGIYFYELRTEKTSLQKKMILLK